MRKIKHPKIGQYVLFAKWSDKDPQDSWYVGFVSEIIIREKEIAYKFAGDNREWKHIWSITEQEGRAWLERAQQSMHQTAVAVGVGGLALKRKKVICY